MKKILSQASAYIVAKEQIRNANWWIKYTREDCRKSNKKNHHNDKFFFGSIYKDLREFSKNDFERFSKSVKIFQEFPSDENYTYMLDKYSSLLSSLAIERRFCNQ